VGGNGEKGWGGWKQRGKRGDKQRGKHASIFPPFGGGHADDVKKRKGEKKTRTGEQAGEKQHLRRDKRAEGKYGAGRGVNQERNRGPRRGCQTDSIGKAGEKKYKGENSPKDGMKSLFGQSEGKWKTWRVWERYGNIKGETDSRRKMEN